MAPGASVVQSGAMYWILLIVLLACSAVMSGAETALFGVGREALQEFAHAGPWRRRVNVLMQHPRRVLLTVLMGNTATNVAFFAVSFVFLQHHGKSNPGVAAAMSLALFFALLILGEVVPKSVALRNTQRLAPAAAAVIGPLEIVLRPVRWLLDQVFVVPLTRLIAPATPRPTEVSTEELRLLVEHSAREGHINSTENDLLQAVVALADVSVRDVMTPRVDIQFVSVDGDRRSVLAAFEESKRRRLPICGKNLDDVRGMILVRDVYLGPQAPIRTLVRRVRFVPEQVNLLQLLRFFKEEDAQMAIVVDEYGGTAGLVTAEDVVQWIVGGVSEGGAARAGDEAERIDEDTYRLSGDLSVRFWPERFVVDETEHRVDTVGGLVLSRLGRLPRAGDEVRISNLTLTVEAVNKRRIESVLLRREPESVNAGDQP